MEWSDWYVSSLPRICNNNNEFYLPEIMCKHLLLTLKLTNKEMDKEPK